MISNIKEIKLVEQVCKNSCVAACLSMVTNIEINELINYNCNEYGILPPYTRTQIVSLLVNNKIYPMQNSTFLGSFIDYNSINLLIVRSKNIINGKHCIVLTKDLEGELKLFDPSRKNKYTLEEMDRSEIIDSYRLLDTIHGDIEI